MWSLTVRDGPCLEKESKEESGKLLVSYWQSVTVAYAPKVSSRLKALIAIDLLQHIMKSSGIAVLQEFSEASPFLLMYYFVAVSQSGDMITNQL